MPGSSKPLLIFDFDGTLANTLETGVGIYNEMAGDYNLPTVTMAEVKETWNQRFKISPKAGIASGY